MILFTCSKPVWPSRRNWRTSLILLYVVSLVREAKECLPSLTVLCCTTSKMNRWSFSVVLSQCNFGFTCFWTATISETWTQEERRKVARHGYKLVCSDSLKPSYEVVLLKLSVPIVKAAEHELSSALPLLNLNPNQSEVEASLTLS